MKEVTREDIDRLIEANNKLVLTVKRQQKSIEQAMGMVDRLTHAVLHLAQAFATETDRENESEQSDDPLDRASTF